MARRNSADTRSFRTDDMALATYLKLLGFNCDQVGWEGDVCFWHFENGDELLRAVGGFHSGYAKVEVREYNREFSSTKREFYDSQPPRAAADRF